jgi:tetratricopeptide (TPR) repeat protein
MNLRGVLKSALAAALVCSITAVVANGEDAAPNGSSESSNLFAKDLDFGPYMADLQRRIKRRWYPPVRHDSTRIVASFKIYKDGIINFVKLLHPSGVPRADDAGLLAIYMAAPMRPLPDGANDNVDVQFTFDYNVFPNADALDATIANWQKNPDENADKLTKAFLQQASAYANHHDYDKSQKTYKHAAAIVEKQHGINSIDMASLLQSEARDLYCAKEDYAGAKTMLDQAMGILKQGSHPVELSHCEQNMAILVAEPQGDWPTAEQLLTGAVKDAKQSKNLTAQMLAVAELADCYAQENKNTQASKLLAESLDTALTSQNDEDVNAINEIRRLIFFLSRVDEQKADQISEEFLEKYDKRFGSTSDQYRKILQLCVLLSDKTKDPEFFAKYGAKYDSSPASAPPTVAPASTKS